MIQSRNPAAVPTPRFRSRDCHFERRTARRRRRPLYFHLSPFVRECNSHSRKSQEEYVTVAERLQLHGKRFSSSARAGLPLSRPLITPIPGLIILGKGVVGSGEACDAIKSHYSGKEERSKEGAHSLQTPLFLLLLRDQVMKG